MDAGSLNCPDCGAAVPANSTECAFCHARLATIGCPKCYALVFVGSKHCQRCGADVGQPADRDAKPLDCPRKCGTMRAVRFGGADMYLCETCNGLWVDRETPSVSVSATPMDDPWKIVRPILDGDDAKLIINALATFTGRRKL